MAPPSSPTAHGGPAAISTRRRGATGGAAGDVAGSRPTSPAARADARSRTRLARGAAARRPATPGRACSQVLTRIPGRAPRPLTLMNGAVPTRDRAVTAQLVARACDAGQPAPSSSAALWRVRDLIAQLTVREKSPDAIAARCSGFAWSLVDAARHALALHLPLRRRLQGAVAGQRARSNLSEFGLISSPGSPRSRSSTNASTARPGLITGFAELREESGVSARGPAGQRRSGRRSSTRGISVVLLRDRARGCCSARCRRRCGWLPLCWLPLVCLALGLSWFLASLGVFLRDIGHTMAWSRRCCSSPRRSSIPARRCPTLGAAIVDFNPLTPDGREHAAGDACWACPGLAGVRVLAGRRPCRALSRPRLVRETKRAFADVI